MHPIALTPVEKWARTRRGLFWLAGLLGLVALGAVFSPRPPPPAASPSFQATRTDLPLALKDSLALLINQHGELCAEVERVTLRGHNLYDVSCTRYRDGSGSATYAVDLSSGSVK